MLCTNPSVARMLYLEKAASHTGLKEYIDTLSYKPLLPTEVCAIRGYNLVVYLLGPTTAASMDGQNRPCCG